MPPASFSVSEGLPTAPAKFVIRYNGNLVRAGDGLPLLFRTQAEAEITAKQLNEAEQNNGRS